MHRVMLPKPGVVRIRIAHRLGLLDREEPLALLRVGDSHGYTLPYGTRG